MTDIKNDFKSFGKFKDSGVNVSINSVYYLLTKLCEKLLVGRTCSASNKLVKKCRSRAFEILLSRKIFKFTDEILLEGNSDPYCHLLAWQFILINQHNLSDHARKLQKCVYSLQTSNSLNEELLSNILYVLLKLRRLPEDSDVISISNSSLALEDKMKFRYFDSSKFKLNTPMICSESKFSNESFVLNTRWNIQQQKYMRARYLENNVCYNCNHPQMISCRTLECTVNEEDSYEGIPKEDEGEDIWELASKGEFNDRRTWESLGNPCPNKELPFLSEAPSKVCSDVYSIHTSNILRLLGEHDSKPAIVERQRDFISHVKNLLVGITSTSFKRDEKGEMYLVAGVTTEGVTTLAMEFYSRDLLLCSSCYTALDNLCNFRSPSEDHQSRGFIFKELCDSINRYLGYYRLAVHNIGEETCNLLSVHNYVRPLLSQLTVLSSVCKVGPFTESSRLSNGVSLLNYLYQKTVELTDKEVIMVLYSVLYPCVQIYFNRFLQQWIFEGTVNDPYGEFFIVANGSYLRTRGRTYWTRSHTVRVDMVPDFLSDLAQDILLCGKTVNLLRLSVPSSPLCLYLLGKKPNLLSCCLSADQVSALERNSACYYLEVMAECGPRFRVSDLIAKSSEMDTVFTALVTKKRALTLKRLELEKLNDVEKEIERKRAAAAELKRLYDEALQDKKLQLIRHVEREMKSNEELLKIQNLKQKLIAEEALNLIEYYEKLSAVSEQKLRDAQRHVDRLKEIDLIYPNTSPPKERDTEKESSETTPQEIYVVVEEEAEKAEEHSTVLASDISPLATATPDVPESLPQLDPGKHEKGTDHEIMYEGDDGTRASLDIVNANSEGDTTQLSEVGRIAAENFERARRNKARVLTEVMGAAPSMPRMVPTRPTDLALSDLERNRLRVMSSEYNLYGVPERQPRRRDLTTCEINRRRVMGSSECFRPIAAEVDTGEKTKTRQEVIDAKNETTTVVQQSVSRCDNDDYNNANANWNDAIGGNEANVTVDEKKNQRGPSFPSFDVKSETEENGNVLNDNSPAAERLRVEEKNSVNKSMNLKLDLSELSDKREVISTGSIFSRFLRSPNFELDKPVPMSLGSTPCLDSGASNTEIRRFEALGSAPTTAATNFTDDGFDFDGGANRKVTEEKQIPVFFGERKDEALVKRPNLSKRVSVRDACAVSTRAIKIFIQQSVSVPVHTQIKLVNNELLKYIFDDLQLLAHLNSLRSYFFLLDGEFGRNITENLFEKLYDVDFPVDLMNYRTLQHLVYGAIDSSIKCQRNAGCLSFKINSLPDTFNLEDPDVLECLSLSYKVNWPLNILLPADAIGKYDDVFKFLLKLNRVSWVLKKIMQELKLLSKKCGALDTYLVLSTQFQRLHQNRHIMTHFVQTLQNYVVGEVLQTSWAAFERKLTAVNNVDEIYLLHVAYIKNILFTCLLNERSLPIRKLILKIFTVVLKFYHYLRAADWTFDSDSCAFEHPNFKKLEDIFRNFEELAVYFVKVARKVAKVGYQPHLVQLLDMLNVNDYYTSRTNVSRSQSNNSTLGSANASL